jgi:osmotically-inducible protein OsmY
MRHLVERLCIERQILEDAGQHVLVEQVDGVLVLTGIVDSAQARQHAEDIAAAAASGLRIQNDLETETGSPLGVADLQTGEPSGTEVDELSAGSELEPDFAKLPVDWTSSEGDGEAEGEPTLAPIDPVIGVNQHGRVQIVGGFSPDAMTAIEVELSAQDARAGDEALAEAVKRALREDAATTSLSLDIIVRRGVVRLRGSVPGLEDDDNAEAVAARVPGVVDVVDDLDVIGI